MTTQMTIAAQAPGLPAAVMQYMHIGLSVIPLIGKKPALPSWSQYQAKRATSVDLARWSNLNQLQNIGIVCGKVSNNLVVLDADGDAMCQQFEERWPDLVTTFTVRTGSGRGKHYYYTTPALPPTTRAMLEGGNLELRANGCYVVAAPSIHPETNQPYSVAVAAPVLMVADFSPVVEWLNAAKHSSQHKESRQQPADQSTNPQATPVVKNATRWAASAMEYEFRALLLTPKNGRNNRLNQAAYNLGQIIGDGHLARHQVENGLLSIAYAIGLDEGEIGPTIRSGIEAGMRQPRSQQWKKRGQ